jgi:hypothetical protein
MSDAATTSLISDEILEAVDISASLQAGAPNGSPERMRGITLRVLVSQFRQMRSRLAVVDPGWRPTK